MAKSKEHDERREQLEREQAIGELVEAIDTLIEERIREATTTNPYYGGSAWDARQTIHIKLRKILGLPDPEEDEE